MTKEEIYKEVEKELLTHFDAKVLMPMYERLAVIIMESTIKAINYTHCCESDSEQLHTEVFNLANKLAINGYGNEAIRLHVICNGM